MPYASPPPNSKRAAKPSDSPPTTLPKQQASDTIIATVRSAIATSQECDHGDLAIVTPTTDSAYRTRWPHAAHTARWWRATIHAATKDTTVRLIDNDSTLPLTIMTNIQPPQRDESEK